jgi:hypothetical protein
VSANEGVSNDGAIPRELEAQLQNRAAERGSSMELVVREALEWYLRVDAELLDELSAWHEVRDEAFEIVEGPTS